MSDSGDPLARAPIGAAPGYLTDAAAARRAALEIIDDPDPDPEHVIGAAGLLARLGEGEKAFDVAARAFRQLGRPLRHAAVMLDIAQRVAHFPAIDALTRQLSAAYAQNRFDEAQESPATNLRWCDDERINVEVASRWSQRVMPEVAAAPGFASPPAGRRLRIGYLSSDAVPVRIEGLLRHHDRSRFELFIYQGARSGDPGLSGAVNPQGDHLHDLSALADSDAARLIRSHGLDLLVDLDDPVPNGRMRLLASRPAPVQIAFPSRPGSVGGRVVDYLVGDSATFPPGIETSCPEQLIRIDPAGLFIDRPRLDWPEPRERADFGLPTKPGTVVAGVFSPIAEVRPEVWTVWMDLLKRLPNLVLWVGDPGPVARRHLAIAVRQAGIDQRGRIRMAPALPRDDHLARLACCDLILLPWPGGIHPALQDALVAGVPVFALEGRNAPGRAAAGLLRSLGLGALVQPDAGTWSRRAVALLSDSDALERIRAKLRQSVARAPAFDAEARTRRFESACEGAIDRAFRGLPPESILVEPSTPVTVAPSPVPQPAAGTAPKPTVVLVCGPWSSGTSAMAGFLAKAGLFAPGPYFRVNDPRTPETYEMLALREAMLRLGNEKTLKPQVDRTTAVAILEEFVHGPLAAALRQAGRSPTAPVLLKHALPALFLREFAQVFDLRVVGVLRPMQAIEATRVRRNWPRSFGKSGASVIYTLLMVRPEANVSECAKAREFARACCTEPAGGSPVRVIAGEPGSRPQAYGRDPGVRAGCRKPPLGGSNVVGRNIK